MIILLCIWLGVSELLTGTIYKSQKISPTHYRATDGMYRHRRPRQRRVCAEGKAARACAADTNAAGGKDPVMKYRSCQITACLWYELPAHPAPKSKVTIFIHIAARSKDKKVLFNSITGSSNLVARGDSATRFLNSAHPR